MHANTGERGQSAESPLSEVAVSEIREASGATGRRAAEETTAQSDVTQRKEELELEKLREELHALRESRAEGRSWRPSVRAVITGGLVSLITGAVGYLFGDSLEAKSRAEMRKSTMDAYFAVDNTIAGKRKQMLGYIEAFLAVGDPELQAWVQREKVVVNEQFEKAQKKAELAEAELAQLRARFDAADARLAVTQAELVRAEGELGTGNKMRSRLELERNFALGEVERLKERIKESELKAKPVAAAAAASSAAAPVPAVPHGQ